MAIFRSDITEDTNEEKWNYLASIAYAKFRFETNKKKTFRALSAKEKNVWKDICKKVVSIEAISTTILTEKHQEAYDILGESGLDTFCAFCDDKKISYKDMNRIEDKWNEDNYTDDMYL